MIEEIDFRNLKSLSICYGFPIDPKMFEKLASQIPDNFKHIESLSLEISLYFIFTPLFTTIYRDKKLDRVILGIMNTLSDSLDHLTKFELSLYYEIYTTFYFVPAATKNAKQPRKSLKRLEAHIFERYSVFK